MIDDRLLNAYLNELEALRVHGRELAERYPDIAARLDIGPRRSRDPHVERVVESAAFLAARLRMLVENQATELPLALLNMVAPALLDPVPPMAIVQFGGGSEVQDVPRGTRLDHHAGNRALVCLATTMDTTAAPYALSVARLPAQGNHADGLALRLSGQPPPRLDLFLGDSSVNAVTLIDALAEDLALVEVVQGDDGGYAAVSPRQLRMRGFVAREAALPVRAEAHQAHRLVTEFLVFPEKFHFASLGDLPFRNGTEIRLRFSRPLALGPELPDDLITVNRVPVVNLWRTSATPFEINGRQLEYPVRADVHRYRSVECHSVEEVHLYGSSGAPVRLDPMLAAGDVQETDVRWGTRRAVSHAGAEVMLYFQGLDYRTLGRDTYLAAPQVLASNGDMARRGRVGERLYPVAGLGDWRAALASVPTAYRPALVQSEAMRTLIGYMQSSVSSLASAGRRGPLRRYLRQFPGGAEAAWIDAIGHVGVRPFATLRGGFPQPGVRAHVSFDPSRSPTTSRTLVKRVLTELFDSQRGLNRVEDVVVTN